MVRKKKGRKNGWDRDMGAEGPWGGKKERFDSIPEGDGENEVLRPCEGGKNLSAVRSMRRKQSRREGRSS